MRGWYDNEDHYGTLVAEVDAWKGTPFWRWVAKRGVGGDCVRTAAAIHQATGGIGAIRWPRYEIRGEEPEKLLEHMEACPGLGRVTNELARGDTLVGCDRRDRLLHLAIYMGGGFLWHMSMRHGWCRRHIQVAGRAWEMIAVYRAYGDPKN